MKKLEKSSAIRVLTKVLDRHYVELNKEQKRKLVNLVEALNYNEEVLSEIAELMEIVADSNYKLGAERQNKATFENIKSVIAELEKR